MRLAYRLVHASRFGKPETAGVFKLVSFFPCQGSILPLDFYRTLYTQGGYIPIPSLWASYTPPTWTISLFFYPIVVAAEKHWGPGSVAIQPLSEQTFRDALQKGRFIFVASHGGREPGSFSYSFEPDREFSPADLKPGEAGEQLRFVYLLLVMPAIGKRNGDNF
jgi:hypothetical protein